MIRQPVTSSEYPAYRFLAFDTRKLIVPSQTLFFALSGKQKNGHDFVQDAYSQGVRQFVVKHDFEILTFPNADFIFVDNVLEALQEMTFKHRKQFDLLTIGITGSNGKTIVKEWLNYLLAKKNPTEVVCNPKSYNSQIGVPLSVWGIQPQHKIGIFEAGVSTLDEMDNLARLIDCQIGIFTNIGSAHDEGFENRKAKVLEKLKLFKNATTIIYNADYKLIDKNIRTRFPNKKLKTWSFKKPKADLFIYKISRQKRTRIEAVFQGENQFIEIPYADNASIENAIHCWLLLLSLGYEIADFQTDFRQLPPVALRLSLKAAVNNSTLIDDSYSLDLNSLTIALDFLVQQNTHTKRTLIISDVLQGGKNKNKLYQKVSERLNQKNINRLIGIGRDILLLKPYLNQNIQTQFYPSTADFLRNFKSMEFQNESILLKGARSFEFERIARVLERQLHQAILEVNLNALADNLRIYRSYLKIETKLMIMVKAAAYGSGISEIAKFLEYQNVDYLAVAYTDEGIEIRNTGVKLPILVLNPDAAAFESLILHRLEPEIYSFSMLKNFIQALKNTQQVYPSLDLKNYPIHLKIDTGMKRLGFELTKVKLLQKELKAANNIQVKSIFSHLVASDNTAHDDFTNHQINIFKKVYKKVIQTLQYQPIRHILNSGGISRFPNYQFEMVRLGIGLYGIDNNEKVQQKLKNISTLKATISQIKFVKKGKTVGYNRKGKATKDMRIATIGIGYADGFSRLLSNGIGNVILHGKVAKVIGNVCMDMTMIDISEIKEAKEGDEVIIFGKEKPIQQLAKELNTISYEVFTNISERVKRVYYQE
jgi:alanine racemase